jgi:uncharacterized protein GlcG (DUF336 family)
MRIVDAAVTKAEEVGQRSVVAVVDVAGELKAYCRMDGAPLLSVSIAQNKAYTSAAFGMPTHQWHDFIKDDHPLLHGIVHTPRLVVFGGGYPIVVDGAVVGAIGISGGHYSDDMAVAEGALAAVGLG